MARAHIYTHTSCQTYNAPLHVDRQIKKQATKRPKTIREDDMVQTACPAWRHIQSLVPCVTLVLQGSAVKGGGRTAEAEETEEEEEEEEKAEEAEDAYEPGKCRT